MPMLTIFLSMNAQNVGIGTSTPDAKLEITATDAGILIPRVELTGTTDVTTISDADTSEIVYNSATVSDVTPGFYYWNGGSWERMLISGDVDGDDLGDHISTENIQLSGYYLSNDGDDEGVYIDASGNVGIGTTSPEVLVHIKNDNSNDGQLLVSPSSLYSEDGIITIRGARDATTTQNTAQLRFENYDRDIPSTALMGVISAKVENHGTNIGSLTFNASFRWLHYYRSHENNFYRECRYWDQ